VGKLWCAGVEIRWPALPDASARRRIALPTYPFERQSYWLETQASRPADALAKNPNAAAWLYVPSWKRVLPPAPGMEEKQPAAWLVFADEAGFARALVRKLRSAGHHVVTVRAGARFQQHDAQSFTIVPANAQHYDLLLRALNGSLPERIVHAWSVTGSLGLQEGGMRFTRAQALGFYSLVYLARALGAAVGGREVRLCAVSNNVQDVGGTEALCPEKATLLGPCLVIRQEYPNIRVKSIDLDAAPQAGGQEAAADLVLSEWQHWDANVLVACRNGQRWAQSQERVPVRQGTGPQFRERGVYLITGGLGRVGAAIAQYLAQRYQARLVLVGRSRVPARQACARIEQLGGEVLYVDANVADELAMRAALARAQQRFGALHGVIHAAGMVRPDSHREIKDSDYSSCEEHFQAKAHGVRVLEQVLEGRALDFCLLVSSLVSVLGGIGHVAYAAASNYMDAFARAHNRSARQRWLSVNWDFWRLEDHSGLGSTVEHLGMSAEEATCMLEIVLALRGAGQLMVSTGELGARLDQWVKLESLESPRAAPKHEARRRGALAAPRDETERRICRIWQDALGVEEVGIDQSFFELGGHSLLAIRVIVELRKTFGIDLPVKALFDAATVAELARRVDGLTLLEKARLPGETARAREEIEL
jgi:acyl transferase domain-containing protein/acyl carrier protein